MCNTVPLMDIKKVELRLCQKGSNFVENPEDADKVYSKVRIGIYEVNGDVVVGTNPVVSSRLIDYELMKSEEHNDKYYTFDITALAEEAYVNKDANLNMVLKLINSNQLDKGAIDIYGDNDEYYHARLIVTYEPVSFQSEAYRYHTHELGRLGIAKINICKGNFVIDSTDFSWKGNRMPVTIKHVYNNRFGNRQYTEGTEFNDIVDFSEMKVGYGYRLNLMQCVVYDWIMYENEEYPGYIITDENGNKMYFKDVVGTERDEYTNRFHDVYGWVEDKNVTYDPHFRKMQCNGSTYEYDVEGRLIKITDSHGNTNVITYNSGRITSITDGAGRAFEFAYTWDGYLSSITAPDDTSICYAYSNGFLSQITYPDGSKALISSHDSVPGPICITLKDPKGNNSYHIAYTYDSKGRISTIKEFGVRNGKFEYGVGNSYTYNIAAGTTKVTTTLPKDECECETQDTIINTVYTYDDEGNILGEYAYTTDTDNVQVKGEAGINPYMGEKGMCYERTVDNMLRFHQLSSLYGWETKESTCGTVKLSENRCETHFGNSNIAISGETANACEGGIKQTVYSIGNKGAHTFSAYVKVKKMFIGDNIPGVFLRVTDAAGNILAESEHLKSETDGYIRLSATFEKYTGNVTACILVNGKGKVYVDGAQFEKGDYAGEYNLIENGSFELGTNGWTMVGRPGPSIVSGTAYNRGSSLRINTSLDFAEYAYQSISINSNHDTKETFILSGWAKGTSLPRRDRNDNKENLFRLRAVIEYYYGEKEEFCANFSSATEEWQYASVQFSKSKYRSIQSLKVYCEYEFNEGSAYFDGISLVRNSIETGLTQGDFATTDKSEDKDAPEDKQNDPSDSVSDDDLTEFEEEYDMYGNPLTQTTYKDGCYGTIYRSFGYNGCSKGKNNSGNDRIRETDARGNDTLYTVDPESSRVTSVKDRVGTKTTYEYDSIGRNIKTSSYGRDGNRLSYVEYEYDDHDNVEGITRSDGMKYDLSYNEFHRLSAIGINGKTNKLVNYEYRAGNGRLKQVSYANGDVMKITYNRLGQAIRERWCNVSGTCTSDYRYTYDGQGNIVRSVDVIRKIEYNYSYEQGRLIRQTECSVTFNTDGIITKRTLKNSILYSYDKDGKLVKKTITTEGKSTPDCVIRYDNENESGKSVKTVCGSTRYTSHTGSDEFGRKTFDEIQTGVGFITRQFTYHKGVVTDEHRNYEKMKSGPITELVKQITLSDGRTLSYSYDKEERITKVVETRTINSETVTSQTEYTYDAMGQLLEEKRDGNMINRMTYDSKGNIKSRNGVQYTYGDSIWKDKLTGWRGYTITYDSQGNPVNYRGAALAWEKGRQLKRYGSNSYTYNAGGIRTSKTVGGVTHTYRLDGNRILSETWESNILTPLYDCEDSVCGIIYNGAAYYFIKNLQGDVIGIKDSRNINVAEYIYDAWGVCTVVSDTTEEGIASINPYRYRSYYYDEETKLYYLQSRYYDPEVGRFLNADSVEWITTKGSILEKNMFIYCQNDCVNKADEFGFGGVDAILDALSLCIDIIVTIIESFASFYNKERKALEKSLKLLTKKQKKSLKQIKELQEEIHKKSKKLGWIGKALTIFSVISCLTNICTSGDEVPSIIAEMFIECFVAIIEFGAGELFEMIGKLFPYIGIFLSFLAGWLVSYMLEQYFDDDRIKKIKRKFLKNIRGKEISLSIWVDSAVKSLSV